MQGPPLGDPANLARLKHFGLDGMTVVVTGPAGRLTGTQLADPLGRLHSKIYKLEGGRQTATLPQPGPGRRDQR
ncbi:hypothetical protein OHT77_40420 [Streptomyces sp. NBC_00252]|nr:hypothetical protein [Streptomyces sp. NBC_00252]